MNQLKRYFTQSTKGLKIKSISAYSIKLPLKEKSYNWSEGKSISTPLSTIVKIETNQSGLVGYGEVCPLGSFYLPSYAKGVRTGIEEIGPQIIGLDPTQVMPLNAAMHRALKGHPYVKSAIDMACWDILGKVTNEPVSTLLGGSFDYDIPLYRAISQSSPKEMAINVLKYKKEGYRKFQLKVGGNPNEDIERIKSVRAALDPTDVLIADANTGWLPHQALQIVRACKDIDIYIEQPCFTYDECLSVRRNTNHPFILDETIDGIDVLLRAHKDKAMDCINIKMSKLGGLTPTKQVRDLAVSMGLGMIIEDSWGGDIITAAISHLAQSTNPNNVIASTDFNSYVTQATATGSPKKQNGTMRASKSPGLGVTPIKEILEGKPILYIDSAGIK